MTPLRRRAAAGAAAVLAAAVSCLVGAAATASAAPTPPTPPRIVSAAASDGRLTVEVDVGPSLRSASPDDLHLTLDGQALTVDSTVVHASGDRRALVLAVDPRLVGSDGRGPAASIITSFLATVPNDVRVGLVELTDPPLVLAGPTTGRGEVSDSLVRLAGSGAAPTPSAVLGAVRAAGADGDRSVLLFSAGAPAGSAAPAAFGPASAAARKAGVRIDVTSVDGGDDPLARLAEGTSGYLTDAMPGNLALISGRVGTALGHRVVLGAALPDGVEGDARGSEVGVTWTGAPGQGDTTTLGASAGGAAAGGEAAAPGGTSYAVPTAEEVSGPHQVVVYAAVAAIGLSLLVVLLVLLGERPDRRGTKLVEAYLSEGPRRAERSGPSWRRLAAAFEGRVGHEGGRTERLLLAAGSRLTPSELVLMAGALGLLALVAGWALGGGVLGVIAAAVVSAAPWLVLRRRRQARLTAFSAQLPDALTTIASSLSAGFSLPQAVDMVAKEGHEPIGPELRRALAEQRLGVEMTDALDEVALRMDSQDLTWITMAIRIQQEVGGNLAEILDQVAETVRERHYIARQVRTMSAEGRLSAWILGGLPVVMFLYLLVVNRPFVRPLYTDPLGFLILGIAAALLGIACFVMSRLVKVDY